MQRYLFFWCGLCLAVGLLSIVVINLIGEFSQNRPFWADDEYWPNGRLKSRLAFDLEGQPHGLQTFYLQDGRVDYTMLYEHGVLIEFGKFAELPDSQHYRRETVTVVTP